MTLHRLEDDIASAAENDDDITRWMQDRVDAGIAELEAHLAKRAAFADFLLERGPELPI